MYTQCKDTQRCVCSLSSGRTGYFSYLIQHIITVDPNTPVEKTVLWHETITSTCSYLLYDKIMYFLRCKFWLIIVTGSEKTRLSETTGLLMPNCRDTKFTA